MEQCANRKECQYSSIWLPHPHRNKHGARDDHNAPCEQLVATEKGLPLDPEPLFRSVVELLSTGASSSWEVQAVPS
jgi:hypothetical protein